MLVPRLENFAEGPSSKHFRVKVDVVTMLQLNDTLLSLAFEHSLLGQRFRWSNQLVHLLIFAGQHRTLRDRTW